MQCPKCVFKGKKYTINQLKAVLIIRSIYFSTNITNLIKEKLK